MIAQGWKDFRVLKTGDGLKLEKWGDITLLRPDPQIIWKGKSDLNSVDCHAKYQRSSTGGGHWKILKTMPDQWKVHWEDCEFYVKPTGFKHTGIFPEQAINWSILKSVVKNAKRQLNVLNLFAYTGAVTAVLAKHGAFVTHVDAAKGMLERAKLNVELNTGRNDAVRFIADDCKKFVQRQYRRGVFYDGIIMDPPSYGRGPSGEIWKMEDSIFELVSECAKLLKDPEFFLINSYTTGLQPTVLKNILTLNLNGKNADAYEVCLPTDEGIELPCGCSGLWLKDAAPSL